MNRIRDGDKVITKAKALLTADQKLKTLVRKLTTMIDPLSSITDVARENMEAFLLLMNILRRSEHLFEELWGENMFCGKFAN